MLISLISRLEMVACLSSLNSKMISHLITRLLGKQRVDLVACTSCALRRNVNNIALQTAYHPVLLPKSDQLSVSFIQTRQKRVWDSHSEAESDSDSDDEELLKKEKVRNTKVVHAQVDSLRADAVLKHGLGVSRNKIDVMFYEGRIRVNGRKIKKKSQSANINEELDLIMGRSPDNPQVLIVSRLEILKARPSGDYLQLTLRRHKNLLVPNYEEDPWEEPATTDSEANKNNDEIEKNLG